MLPLVDLMHKFLGLVADGTVEIDQFSLQHEAGVFLRPAVPAEFKVQFDAGRISRLFLPATNVLREEGDRHRDLPAGNW